MGEHREALTDAGGTDVQIVEDRRQGWICAIGRAERRERESIGSATVKA
jgi:hypothetical protein